MPHGEFEDWCDDNLAFSIRKARYMMQLAAKMADGCSVFSNRQTFADLEVSKVWAILAAPEEVAEKVIQDPALPDKTVRELKEEIDRLKKESEAAQMKFEEVFTAAQGLKEETYKKSEFIDTLKAKIASFESAPKISESSDPKLKEQIAKLKEKLKKAEADKMAREDAESKLKKIADQLKASQTEIAKLQHSKAVSSDALVATFKVQADVMQTAFNACVTAADNADDEQKAKLKGALKTVIESQLKRIAEQ